MMARARARARARSEARSEARGGKVVSYGSKEGSR